MVVASREGVSDDLHESPGRICRIRILCCTVDKVSRAWRLSLQSNNAQHLHMTLRQNY